jgi:hypothetical protein
MTVKTKERNVVEGELVHWISRMRYVVQASCGGSTGRWFCVTHQEAFRNNLEANGHTGDDREHVMAWLCPEHDVEVP